MTGELIANFEFELRGLGLPRPAEFKTKDGLKARLDPGKPPHLSVRIDGKDEVIARAEASNFAHKLYERLLLRFGANVDYSVPPRLVDSWFTPAAAQPSPPTNSVTASIPANAEIVAAATADISDTNLDALVYEIEVRWVTAVPATSAQLYTAIEMFLVGLEARNRVVRFLVLYSSLALAALFKCGLGTQEKVDELLLAQNAAIPVQPSPRPPHRNETQYTKLRNELIHAEGRGGDPAGAMRAIEGIVQQFQRDVILVLSNL
jgi:hypothetical protein